MGLGIVCGVIVLAAGLIGHGRAAERPGEQNLGELARILLDQQSYIRGDRDGGVRFFISASRDLIGTPLAELAVRSALRYDPASLSAVTVGEVEARRILGNEAELTPEHRDALRRYVARSFDASGRREDAMEMHRRRGLAMSWLVAGPFPGLQLAGDYRNLPSGGEIIRRDVVATPPSAEQFREWRRSPPWRAVDTNRSFPYVRPWRGAASRGDGAMLMFTTVDIAEADNKATFYICADTSWRLYVGGVMVAEMDKSSRETAFEHTVAYPLTPGRHKVTLVLFPPPVDADPNAIRAAVRLDAAPAFTWDCFALPPGGDDLTSARREARPPRYLTELHRASAGQDYSIMAAFAMACSEQGLDDAGAWWAETAARAAPHDASLQLLAGVLTSMNPLLPTTRRWDIAGEWNRLALAEKPDLVPSLIFMANLAMDAGRIREAADYLTQANRINPTSIDVLLARGDWARRFASVTTARDVWDEAGRAYPNSPAVQLAIASMPSEGFLDMDRRLAACRSAFEAAPYLSETSLGLAAALADSGNIQEAASVLRNALDLFKGEMSITAAVARLYFRMGLQDDAVAAMEDAVRLSPADDALWRELGDFKMQQGKQDEAIRLWRVSLEANPGQFELRDMINNLEGRPTSLFGDGGRDAITITAEARPDEFEGDIVRLLDRAMVTYTPDGSFRRLTHEIDLARTRAGGEALADIGSRGELLTARIVFPNGNTLEPEPFPGQGGLRLPVIMAGAAREIRTLESVTADDGSPVQPPWFFQDPSGGMALVLSEYIVRVPTGFPLVYVVRDFGTDIEFETVQEDGYDVYRWTAHLSRASREPGAVHVSERLPSVVVGRKTTWDEVVTRELRAMDGRLKPSMRMRRLLEEMIAASGDVRPSPLETARAIYRYVLDDIDPANGGTVAAHIHADRMGDRSILLLSLLRAAGLDAQPAAARPSVRFTHPAVWELPRRDIFTIPMVRLALPGGETYWLDVRFDSLPFGKITDDLSGATVLSFLPEGPLFDTLPTLSAEESIVYKDRNIRLPETDDHIEVTGQSLRRGVHGLRRDRDLGQANADERRRMLLASIYPVFPDAVLKQFDVQRTDDDEASSLERYVVTSKFPLEDRPGGVRSVSLCLLRPQILSQETLNHSRRETSCHIRSVHYAEDRNVFQLPAGGTFVKIPKPAHIPSRFGVYQLRVTVRGDGALEINRKYHIPDQRILPWDWPDFIAFLERVELAEKQWITYTVKPQ